MLTPEMIPQVVVEAAVSTWLNSDGTVRQDITKTLAAAINAWPGIERIYRSEDEKLFSIILPLPQEGE